MNNVNENAKNISAARRKVRMVSAEACTSYNYLCGTQCEETAFYVLDSELRMASKLAELENKIANKP